MHNNQERSWLRPSLAILAVFALAACGSDAPDPAASAATAPVTSKVAARMAELTKGMVNGVTTEKPGAPVSLKFDLKSRPTALEPLQVEVALLPARSGETLRATFVSGSELVIQPSATPAEYQKIEAGTVYRHEITVTPREDGVFYLSAIVQLDAGGEAQVRTFSIPIIVGPAPDAAQKASAPPKKDATGQPIQSTPAR